MDLTEQYALMCDDENVQRPFREDKAELEDNIKWLSWAYLFTDGYGNRITGVYTGIDHHLDPKQYYAFVAFPVYNSVRFWIQSLDKVIWLPDQAELQKRLGARGFSWLVITFFQFCKEQLKKHNWLTGQVDSPLDSLEKLWLAFMMKEKWNKEWKNNRWSIISRKE